MEIWKQAVGYENILEVSNFGNVRTVDRITDFTRSNKTWIWKYKGRKLSPYKEKNGYLTVSPMLRGVRKSIVVHRLVAMTFVEGYTESLSVNHINNNKLDNRADNLEWIFLSENTCKQWKDRLVNLKGENHPLHKLSSKQVLYIRKLLYQKIPAHALAIIANVSPSLIYLIRDSKRWNHLK